MKHGIEHIQKEKILLKKELENLGVRTDRDLLEQLQLTPDGMKLLFKWMEYQSTFNKINYYEYGREDVVEELNELRARKKELLKYNRVR